VLTQVAGRAGRSERGGKVILQTFDPAHQVIQSAARHDVSGFYQYELEQRRRLGYPPFSRLVRLEYRHQDTVFTREQASKVAAKLQELLRTGHGKGITIIGPVPSFFARWVATTLADHPAVPIGLGVERPCREIVDRLAG
jgi:primosomal protein N' (replication factor Y)